MGFCSDRPLFLIDIEMSAQNLKFVPEIIAIEFLVGLRTPIVEKRRPYRVRDGTGRKSVGKVL